MIQASVAHEQEAVEEAMTTYKPVGGLKTFRRLARVFYARVTHDPVLTRLFSKESDKRIERLALFLAETFGGPRRYSLLHCGQQSLQQMHGAFVIGEQEIKVWKKHMYAAMDEVGIEGSARRVMRGFFCGGLRQIAASSATTAASLPSCCEGTPSKISA